MASHHRVLDVARTLHFRRIFGRSLAKPGRNPSCSNARQHTAWSDCQAVKGEVGMKHVWSGTRRRAAATLFTILVCGAATMWAAGTTMTLTFVTPTVVCAWNGGSVSAPYTIATTAGDGATVTETLSLNGNEVTSHAFTIASGNVLNGGGWTFAGRTKTYDGAFTANGLADGTYTLEVCAVQNGANGNPGKSACQSETIVVSCGSVDSACASGPFGEVVGNRNIGVQAAAQVNFRGDFGDLATLDITGPNGFSAEAIINRDGNSCNYHANWKFTNASGADIYGNDGPGTYTLVATGNGHVLTFWATLDQK